MTAGRAHVGLFVRALTERAGRRGTNVVALDPGSGLSNATIQRRIVPVRLFYDHLMEEGCGTPTQPAEDASHRDGAATGLGALLRTGDLDGTRRGPAGRTRPI
ncbi:hypothetical protein AB0392_04320 [Nonomuraea angiospora]|uniref:hypothetical protein n=1 Tax=Nonomuraea angiospora TaxID=46172 RepID=UPI00344FA726